MSINLYSILGGLCALLLSSACSNPVENPNKSSSSTAVIDSLESYTPTSFTNSTDSVMCWDLYAKSQMLYISTPYQGIIQHPHGTNEYQPITIPNNYHTTFMTGDSDNLWISTQEMVLLQYHIPTQKWSEYPMPDTLYYFAKYPDTLFFNSKTEQKWKLGDSGCQMMTPSPEYNGTVLTPFNCWGYGSSGDNFVGVNLKTKQWFRADGYGRPHYNTGPNPPIGIAYENGEILFGQIYRGKLYYSQKRGNLWRWDGNTWEPSGRLGISDGFLKYNTPISFPRAPSMIVWDNKLILGGGTGNVAYIDSLNQLNYLGKGFTNPVWGYFSEDRGYYILGYNQKLVVHHDTLYAPGARYSKENDFWVDMYPVFIQKPYKTIRDAQFGQIEIIGDTIYTCREKTGKFGKNGIYIANLKNQAKGNELYTQEYIDLIKSNNREPFYLK